MNAKVLNALTREPDVTPREAAAYWLMRAQSGDFSAADRAEFAAWLAENPEHPRIYEFVRGTWEFAGAAATAPEILMRREIARGRLAPLRSRGWRASALAATVLAAMIGGA